MPIANQGIFTLLGFPDTPQFVSLKLKLVKVHEIVGVFPEVITVKTELLKGIGKLLLPVVVAPV